MDFQLPENPTIGRMKLKAVANEMMQFVDDGQGDEEEDDDEEEEEEGEE